MQVNLGLYYVRGRQGPLFRDEVDGSCRVRSAIRQGFVAMCGIACKLSSAVSLAGGQSSQVGRKVGHPFSLVNAVFLHDPSILHPQPFFSQPSFSQSRIPISRLRSFQFL